MKKMILLEKDNHAIGLDDLHMTVGLEILDETAGPENNRGGWRNSCRLTTSELNEVPPTVIDVRRQCKMRDTRELSNCLPCVERSRTIYSTGCGGHDKLGSLEARNELAGLSSGSMPCAVVWSLVMTELIQEWTLSGLGLTSTSGLEWALGWTCLAVGCWFIHAGQGINGGGDHRSRNY